MEYELSERILPYVEGLAKNLDLEVNLIGIYGGPLVAGGAGDGLYSSDNSGSIERYDDSLQCSHFPRGILFLRSHRQRWICRGP